MRQDWTFEPADYLFRFFTCHLGVAGNKFMKSREERGEAPETDQERRERQNAQIIIKWWMLVPGFRPLIILLSQGNPDQALKYKSIQDLQVEKNQTYRAFAVMGQLNLVTSTIPCAIIGVMMMDWSKPTDDVAQLVFAGMALCSATLSVITMCFGVIDGLVNTIDTMDRSLNDYRAQQKSMRETITYAKQHFDDITTLSDDLGHVLARFRSLPGFNPTRRTKIISSDAVSAIAACRASINAFVCEDFNQLELVNKIREQIHKWLHGGDGLDLSPEAYWIFEMLKGDLMKWSMQYADHLERALESVDNMTLNDSEFDRVREMLEEKQGQWNHVAGTSTNLFHKYNAHKAFANIIPGYEKNRGIPGVQNGMCSCEKPLEHFKADHDRYMCNQCDEYKPLFADLYGCRDCDVDICQLCYDQMVENPADLRQPQESPSTSEVFKDSAECLDYKLDLALGDDFVNYVDSVREQQERKTLVTIPAGPKTIFFLEDKGKLLLEIKSQSGAKIWIDKQAGEIYVHGEPDQIRAAEAAIQDSLRGAVGQPVIVEFKGENYPATLQAENEDGTYNILYDDETLGMEKGCARERIQFTEFPDRIKEDDEEILCEEDGGQSDKRSALRSESIALADKRVPYVDSSGGEILG